MPKGGKAKCQCGDCSYCKHLASNRAWNKRKRVEDAAWREANLVYQKEYVAKRLAEDPEYLEYKRERSARAARRRRAKVSAIVNEAKRGPCVDCGVHLPPEVMDLDHVRGEKRFGIGHRGGGGNNKYRSIAEILEEIEKCELRCPNCHRLRHYYERQATKQPRMEEAA